MFREFVLCAAACSLFLVAPPSASAEGLDDWEALEGPGRYTLLCSERRSIGIGRVWCRSKYQYIAIVDLPRGEIFYLNSYGYSNTRPIRSREGARVFVKRTEPGEEFIDLLHNVTWTGILYPTGITESALGTCVPVSTPFAPDLYSPPLTQ